MDQKHSGRDLLSKQEAMQLQPTFFVPSISTASRPYQIIGAGIGFHWPSREPLARSPACPELPQQRHVNTAIHPANADPTHRMCAFDPMENRENAVVKWWILRRRSPPPQPPNCCSPENLGSPRVNVDGIIALARIRRALLTDDVTEVAPLIIPDSD